MSETATTICTNEEWVAENPDHTIEWARTMWSCDCVKCDAPLTFGQRFDAIGERMDAAYANRRKVVARGHKPGSAEYVAADDQIEAVYRDLRALNAEVAAR